VDAERGLARVGVDSGIGRVGVDKRLVMVDEEGGRFDLTSGEGDCGGWVVVP
jgi:hypothetical protein